MLSKFIWWYCRHCPITMPTTNPSATRPMSENSFISLKQINDYPEDLLQEIKNHFENGNPIFHFFNN